MGRIRSIKPEFFQHEVLFDAERESGLPLRLAFAGLWTQCDREGRFKWRPRTLKAAVLPFDEIEFSRVLDALTTRGFLVKYEVSGDDFGYIPSWSTHQYVNGKEQASILPIPPENKPLDATVTCEPRVNDAIVTDGVKEGKGREGKVEVFDASFDGGEWALKTCKAYPTWANPEAFVVPDELAKLYYRTIEKESPYHGGLLKTAEWFLSVVKQYGRQHPDGKFVQSLDKFIRQGYAEVKVSAAKPQKSLVERMVEKGMLDA